MDIVAIQSRRPERGMDVYRYCGLTGITEAGTSHVLEDAIRARKPVVTDDAFLLAQSEQIDVLVDTTGSVEFGARVLLEAFERGKDVVLLNAEIDATIGPILQVYAAKSGAILSACDGDEPGVQMNLFRWVKGLGLIPRVVGNIKGLQDPYRNPTTQRAFADKWGQHPAMVTSFADGSKISFEQAIVANATGFVVKSRGMSRGLEYRGDVMQIGSLYDLEELRQLGGIVDYVVGTPLTKVYCLAEHPDPKQQHYLNLYKIGDGPLYSFFTPYHLVHFEVPTAIARVALFRDFACEAARRSGRRSLCSRKTGPQDGEVLDDYGQFMTYGEAVEYRRNERELLPARRPGRGLSTYSRRPEGHRTHL